MKRLAGLETEYGCLAPNRSGLPAVPTRVRDHIFKKRKLGLIDLHDRDYDEPAGNGGFLFNGGRLYLDMGHVEYCTPECLSLTDVVAYDQVGEVSAAAGVAGAASRRRGLVPQEQHRPLHERDLRLPRELPAQSRRPADAPQCRHAAHVSRPAHPHGRRGPRGHDAGAAPLRPQRRR